jgi:hypothetical protein
MPQYGRNSEPIGVGRFTTLDTDSNSAHSMPGEPVSASNTFPSRKGPSGAKPLRIVFSTVIRQLAETPPLPARPWHGPNSEQHPQPPKYGFHVGNVRLRPQYIEKGYNHASCQGIACMQVILGCFSLIMPSFILSCCALIRRCEDFQVEHEASLTLTSKSCFSGSRNRLWRVHLENTALYDIRQACHASKLPRDSTFAFYFRSRYLRSV